MRALGLLFLILSSSTYALTNSQFTEDPSFDSVVFIQNQGLDDHGDVTAGYCNGTLISKNTIVTAAHCVAQAEALSLRETHFEIGRYKYVKTKTGENRRIGYTPLLAKTDAHSRFHFLPEMEKQIRAHGVRTKIPPELDMALIVLTEDLPLESLQVVPAQLASPVEIKSISQNILAYAPRIVTINPFSEITTLDTKRFANFDRIRWSSKTLTSKSKSRVDPGDSGAPVFVRIGRDWKLIAVTKGRADTLLDSWDVFALISPELL